MFAARSPTWAYAASLDLARLIAVRAGPDAMRDPPKNWSRVDEALDQSYPASDPANLNPHID